MNEQLWNQIKILDGIKVKHTQFLIDNVSTPNHEVIIQKEMMLNSLISLLSSLESTLIICEMIQKELPPQYHSKYMQRTEDFIKIFNDYE